MFFSLQHRTSSFLGSPVWCTEPWRNQPKDIEQTLYDLGFALAALVEEIDRSLHSNSTDIGGQTMLQHLNRCSALDTDLGLWYQEHLRVSPSPLCWVSDSELSNCVENSRPGARSLAPYVFPSLRLALMTVNFWALRLVLSTTVGDACNAISQTQRTNEPALDAPFESTVHPTDKAFERSSQAKSVVEEMAYRHGHDRCFALAVEITRAVSYCTRESMGLLGPQKSLFALRVALYYLRLHPGEELALCWTLYQGLTRKKGMQLAQDLQRDWNAKEDARRSGDVR